MTLYGTIFYILAVLILTSTAIAVTRRNLVHAVIYLVVSFFGTAMLFYLFGAPFLAALEVIIYAGAIMVLFLFIIMMLRVDTSLRQHMFPWSQWLPAVGITFLYLVVGAVLLSGESSGGNAKLTAAVAEPKQFGLFLFSQHWLTIEIISMLLLVALIGALHLGQRSVGKRASQKEGDL